MFAGQGAQTVGMGRDLAEKYDSVRDLFARADERLGFGLSGKMFDGPAAELTRTSVCAVEGSMAALIGGEEADIRRLAEKCDIDVANLNAPGQIVVSGTKAGIAQAIAEAPDFGVRIAQELDVAGAYHSRLMMPAQIRLAEVLRDTKIGTPSLPVVCNVEAAQVSEPDAIRRTLEAQVSGSVRWSECVRHFLDKGETLFIELGPGRVLAGLMRRIERSAKALGFSDVESFEKTLAELSGADQA